MRNKQRKKTASERMNLTKKNYGIKKNNRGKYSNTKLTVIFHVMYDKHTSTFKKDIIKLLHLKYLIYLCISRTRV